MNQVKSKYKNPDKYIERLKRDLKWTKEIKEPIRKDWLKAYRSAAYKRRCLAE